MIAPFFFFYRSFQVSEHRCQMKIDEARTLVQTSSCHESTLWTNVSAYWTYTRSLSFSILFHLSPYRSSDSSYTLHTYYPRIFDERYIRNKVVSLKNHLRTYATLKTGTYMLHRLAGILELWQDGNGVDGETLTWVPLHGGKLRYHVKRNAPYPVLCRTSAVSTGTVFTSRRGAADLYERGTHKPVLAPPHVFTHEPRHRSDRSSSGIGNQVSNVTWNFFLFRRSI